MASRDQQAIQKIVERLEAEDASFKVVRCRTRQPSPLPWTPNPPMTLWASRAQRLEALERWCAELLAVPAEQRRGLFNEGNRMAVEAGVAELERLREELT
jgi:hypothetical protein